MIMYTCTNSYKALPLQALLLRALPLQALPLLALLWRTLPLQALQLQALLLRADEKKDEENEKEDVGTFFRF